MQQNIVKQCFERFVKLVYPKMEKGTKAYSIVELTYYAGFYDSMREILATGGLDDRTSEQVFMSMFEECRKFHKKQLKSNLLGNELDTVK